jgi:hypothetical protein
MNIKKSIKTSLSAVVLGIIFVAALGFWLAGRDSKSQSTAESSSDPAPVRVEAEKLSPVTALRQRIESADADDFPELMRRILHWGNPAEQSQLVSSLMQRWIAGDLSSFVVFLDEAEVEGLEIWELLAPGMADALRAMGDEAPDIVLLGQVVERVVLKVAETDPESALAWARERLSGANLDSALAGIATEMADLSPEAAIALLDEVQSFSNQMQAATGIGLALGRNNYDLAMTWAESFYSETERAFALSGVLHGMAGRDTARAAREYSRVVETMKIRYREQVLADRSASGNTVDEEYEGLSPEEIEKAELAKPNPNLIYLESATRAIAVALAKDNPLKALEWARSMDRYQGRAVAMEAVYEEWGTTDPHMAFQSLMKESDRGSEVAGRFFAAWAMKNASVAARTALTLTSGVERDSAIEGVARGWIDSGGDPAQIAAWGEGLQAVSEGDRVRAIVASGAAFDDPVLALKQVEGIRNPLKRSELFQEVFPNLIEENPQLARNALATSNLSPVEIEYFQSMLGP